MKFISRLQSGWKCAIVVFRLFFKTFPMKCIQEGNRGGENVHLQAMTVIAAAVPR